MKVQFDSRILGGLPVLVHANVYPAEPDVGIFDEQVEIDGIYWMPRSWKSRRTQPRHVPQHMMDRISQHELYELQAEALAA